VSGEELIPALVETDFVRELDALLASPVRAASVGASGRLRVVKSYSWNAHMGGIDRHLAPNQTAQWHT
jgi:hypothetical protein